MRLRSSIAVFLLLAVQASLTGCHDSARPVGHIDRLTERRANLTDQEVQRVLDAEHVDIGVRDTGLADVIDYVRENSQVNFFVDWVDLDRISVSRQTPITLGPGSRTVRQALQQTLDQISPRGVVGYQIVDGLVKIASKDSLERGSYSTTHDLEFLNKPGARTPTTLPTGWAVQQLLDLTLDAQLDNAGKPMDSAVILGNTVIVHSSRDRHERVEMMLSSLKRIIQQGVDPHYTIQYGVEPTFYCETWTPIMEKPLPEVRFSNAAFSDAVDFLHDASQANFVVDWEGLKAAGVSRDTTISYHAKNLNFRELLQGLLDSAKSTQKLKGAIEGDALFISTEQIVNTRVYEQMYELNRFARWRFTQSVASTQPGTTTSPAADPVVALIHRCITPDVWTAHKDFTLVRYRDTIVSRCNLATQKKVRAFVWDMGVVLDLPIEGDEGR